MTDPAIGSEDIGTKVQKGAHCPGRCRRLADRSIFECSSALNFYSCGFPDDCPIRLTDEATVEDIDGNVSTLSSKLDLGLQQCRYTSIAKSCLLS